MPTPNPQTILHRKRRRVRSLHGQVHQYCYEVGEVTPYDELSRSGAFSQRLMKQFADYPVQKTSSLLADRRSFFATATSFSLTPMVEKVALNVMLPFRAATMDPSFVFESPASCSSSLKDQPKSNARVAQKLALAAVSNGISSVALTKSVPVTGTLLLAGSGYYGLKSLMFDNAKRRKTAKSKARSRRSAKLLQSTGATTVPSLLVAFAITMFVLCF
ncbi:unnamed protein product (mitochondrion) [Plasmodiophora brassicae]|uniref:Uncharacterized protein n=1 Tax=Plasmodiophora brassicae TaxID=37360 RepID=A0A3P3Y9I7_PLABS|nr:unnamed protein product [Plasmodiophora brassicae]